MLPYPLDQLGVIMKYVPVSAFLVLLLVLAGCSGLTLRPVDYAWPVESVLRVDSRGMVEESRYLLAFNAKPLLLEETGDSVNVSGVTLRMIRDRNGFYYVTGPKFKHVYVFASSEGSLKLENKIMISEKGMEDPAFNQRAPHIQLLNTPDKPRMLSKSGIEEGVK